MYIVFIFVLVVRYSDAFRGTSCRHISASTLRCKTTLPESTEKVEEKNLPKISSFDKLLNAFDDAQNQRKDSEKLLNAFNDALSAIAAMMRPEMPFFDESLKTTPVAVDDERVMSLLDEEKSWKQFIKEATRPEASVDYFSLSPRVNVSIHDEIPTRKQIAAKSKTTADDFDSRVVYWPLKRKIAAKSKTNADDFDSRVVYWPLKKKIAILNSGKPAMSDGIKVELIIDQQSRAKSQREPITSLEANVNQHNIPSENAVTKSKYTEQNNLDLEESLEIVLLTNKEIKTIYWPMRRNVTISHDTIDISHNISLHDSNSDPFRKPHDMGTAIHYKQ